MGEFEQFGLLREDAGRGLIAKHQERADRDGREADEGTQQRRVAVEQAVRQEIGRLSSG